jgi:hypothetical protein
MTVAPSARKAGLDVGHPRNYSGERAVSEMFGTPDKGSHAFRSFITCARALLQPKVRKLAQVTSWHFCRYATRQEQSPRMVQ